MDLILVLTNFRVIFHLDYWRGAFHLNIQPKKGGGRPCKNRYMYGAFMIKQISFVTTKVTLQE